jgi:hypothetical protein
MRAAILRKNALKTSFATVAVSAGLCRSWEDRWSLMRGRLIRFVRTVS